MKGKDGQLHTLECDADSLFAAAEKGVTEWNRFWWFSSDAVLEIRSGGDFWKVDQARVREGRPARPKSDPPHSVA